MIIAVGRKYKNNIPLDYKDKEGIEKFINNNKDIIFKTHVQRDIFYTLKYTRNAAVHGSVSRGTQEYVEQEERFKQLFYEGLKLYEDILCYA